MSIQTEISKIKSSTDKLKAEQIVNRLECNVQDNFTLTQLCVLWCRATGNARAYDFRNLVSAELNDKFGTEYDIYA